MEAFACSGLYDIWCAKMPQSGLNFEQMVQNSMTPKWPHTFIHTSWMKKKKLTNLMIKNYTCPIDDFKESFSHDQ